MAQSQKRFRRSRKEDDDAQQFTLTERDRELAALAAEILPRNSAAASFERHAARNAGSTSVTARDAVTDHDAVDDDAASRGGTSAGTAGESGTSAAADATDPSTPADAVSTRDTAQHGAKKRKGKGKTKGTHGTAAGTAASSSATAAKTTKTEASAASGTTEEAAEETPAELKARRKRELAAQRREAKAAKAAEREQRAGDYQPTPTWYKVIMVGLMIVALLWIISYYLFQGLIPIPGIGVWNLVIGLAFMLTGLIMTTRWR